MVSHYPTQVICSYYRMDNLLCHCHYSVFSLNAGWSFALCFCLWPVACSILRYVLSYSEILIFWAVYLRHPQMLEYNVSVLSTGFCTFHPIPLPLWRRHHLRIPCLTQHQGDPLALGRVMNKWVVHQSSQLS